MITIRILTLFFLLLCVNSSFSQEKWINYTSMKSINRISLDGNHLWAATTGGVIRWDIENGSYEKYTTAEGLSHNFVRTVVIDLEGNKLGPFKKGDVANIAEEIANILIVDKKAESVED